jgi:hypothetical protein
MMNVREFLKLRQGMFEQVIVPISLGIGFLLPIPFYVVHRFVPKFRLDLVNTPLVCGTFALVLDRSSIFLWLSLSSVAVFFLGKELPS